MSGQPQLFEALPKVIEDALRASILRFGVLVPVVKDQHGNVLDGHHRSRIAAEMKVDYRVDVLRVESDEDSREIQRTLNADRRQLTEQQRQEVALALRQEGHSYRAIAGALGVDAMTVRADILSTVEDSTVELPDRVTGLDGKSRPAKRPTVVAAKTQREAKRAQKALLELEGDAPVGVFDVKEISTEAREHRPPKPAVEVVAITTAFLPCAIDVADAANLPLPDESIDLIVTSPPYGLAIAYDSSDDDQGYPAYMDQVQAWSAELYRIAAPQGRLCLNVPLDTTRGGTQAVYADWVACLKDAGWRYRCTIVWNEGTINKSVARGSVDSPSSPHVIAPVEVIVVAYKGDWNLHRLDAHTLGHDDWLEWTNGLWAFGGEHHADHPAPYPEELPRRCISLFSFNDAVVCDPFVGSGTTAVVAYKLGRTFYGFDQSDQYVAQARARVAQEVAA